VSLVEPGSVATPIWDKALNQVEALGRADADRGAPYAQLMAGLRRETARSAEHAVAPDQVARAVEHALTARRPKIRYLVGGDTRAWLLLSLLPDRWRDAIILSQL
jgi:hypothetical protein